MSNLLSTEELNNLIREYRETGDVIARDKIFERNTALVTSIVKAYPNGSILGFEDLYQEGCLGLLKAIDRFDPEKGFKFSTYATWWIKQAIKRALADNNRSIRIPIHVQEDINRIKKAKKSLEQELNRDPSIEEIQERINIDCDCYEEIVKHEYFKILQDIIFDEENTYLDSEVEEITIIIIEDLNFTNESELVLKELVNHMKKYKTIPTKESIKSRLNLTRKKIVQCLNYDTNVSSLDVPASDDMDACIGDNIASDENVEEKYNETVLFEGIEKAIEECFGESEEKTNKLINALKENIKFFESLKDEKFEVSSEIINNIETKFPEMNENAQRELVKYLKQKTGLRKKDIDEREINIQEAINDLQEKINSKKKPRINKSVLIKKRFGICGYRRCTLEEVGNYFNVSRERVRQVEKKMLKDTKFKNKILEYCNINIEDFD